MNFREYVVKVEEELRNSKSKFKKASRLYFHKKSHYGLLENNARKF